MAGESRKWGRVLSHCISSIQFLTVIRMKGELGWFLLILFMWRNIDLFYEKS
jgi:hypothetical protein